MMSRLLFRPPVAHVLLRGVHQHVLEHFIGARHHQGVQEAEDAFANADGKVVIGLAVDAVGGRRRCRCGRRREQVRRHSQQRGGAPAEAEDRAALAAVGTAVGAGADWVAGATAGDGDAKAEAARGAGEPSMGGSRWTNSRGRVQARTDARAAADGRRCARTACWRPRTEVRERRAGGHGWRCADGRRTMSAYSRGRGRDGRDGSTVMGDGRRGGRGSHIRDGRIPC